MSYFKTKILFNWLAPLAAAGLIFGLLRPVAAQILGRQESLAQHLASGNDVEVGSYGAEGEYRQIYYEFQGERVFVTNGRYTSADPVTDGAYIAWAGQVEGGWQIFLQHILSGETVALTSSGVNVRPRISGRSVVWEGQAGGSWQIFLFDGVAVRQLTEGDLSLNPEVEGDIVAFNRRDAQGQWRAVKFTISTRTSEILGEGEESLGPRVSGGEVILPIRQARLEKEAREEAERQRVIAETHERMVELAREREEQRREAERQRREQEAIAAITSAAQHNARQQAQIDSTSASAENSPPGQVTAGAGGLVGPADWTEGEEAAADAATGDSESTENEAAVASGEDTTIGTEAADEETAEIVPEAEAAPADEATAEEPAAESVDDGVAAEEPVAEEILASEEPAAQETSAGEAPAQEEPIAPETVTEEDILAELEEGALVSEEAPAEPTAEPLPEAAPEPISEPIAESAPAPEPAVEATPAPEPADDATAESESGPAAVSESAPTSTEGAE